MISTKWLSLCTKPDLQKLVIHSNGILIRKIFYLPVLTSRWKCLTLKVFTLCLIELKFSYYIYLLLIKWTWKRYWVQTQNMWIVFQLILRQIPWIIKPFHILVYFIFLIDWFILICFILFQVNPFYFRKYNRYLGSANVRQASWFDKRAWFYSQSAMVSNQMRQASCFKQKPTGH